MRTPDTLVFLLEEPSARELLRGVLPQVVPEHVQVVYQVFEGKQDLEKNISKRIRGWQQPNTAFVVLRDQDSSPDCKSVKNKLVELVKASGRKALVRVACRTLEAWVAGDLEAVAKAYEDSAIAKPKNKQKFRDPDALGAPYTDLKVLVPTYQKVDGARRVGPLLSVTNNNSTSFKVLCSGIRRLFAGEAL